MSGRPLRRGARVRRALGGLAMTAGVAAVEVWGAWTIWASPPFPLRAVLARLLF